MKYLKYVTLSILLSTSVALILHFLQQNVFAQETKPILKAPTFEILDYTDYTNASGTMETIYAYKGESVPPLQNEILSERTDHIITFSDGKKRVYLDNTFYKENETWRSIEYATTTKVEFEKAIQADPIDKISYIFPRVQAADEYTYSYVSIGKDNSTDWNTTHDATSGTNAITGATEGYVMSRRDNGVDPFILYRILQNYDTSEIPSANLDEVNLHITGHSKDGTVLRSYSVFGSTAQESPDATDFDLCGTDTFSNTITHSDFAVAETDNIFHFSATGTAAINFSGYTKLCIRETLRDVADVEPDEDFVYLITYTSAQTGTEYDPYLEFTYEESTTTPTSTPTATTSPYMSSDLSLIVATTYHYASSSTGTLEWIEMTYYHIPFFIYIVIAIPFLWVAHRLFLELLIRWRK